MQHPFSKWRNNRLAKDNDREKHRVDLKIEHDASSTMRNPTDVNGSGDL